MSGREILTLQFGHHSNFVGAHLWNLQESSFDYNADKPSEIFHDVLYREGLTYKNEVTFTPRLLLADLKGSLKSFPEHGGLHDTQTDKTASHILWDKNAIETQQQEKIPHPADSGQTQNLNDTVSVWSDFLYSRFHPRTVNIIREYQHGDEEKAFDVFPLGRDLWLSEQFREDFCDRIRQYLEECDNFQGFHVLLDAHDAFGGLATACLEYVSDEYERKSILALPVLPAHYKDYEFENTEGECRSLIKDSVRVLNEAFCFSKAVESSLVVPLCAGSDGWRHPGVKRNFNHVIYDHKLPYHSSAILATAMDTFTIQHRLRSSNFSLRDLCDILTLRGRKIAAASVCMPFSVNEGDYLLDCLDSWDGPLTRSITPNCNIGPDRAVHVFTLRGVPECRLKKPLKIAGDQKDVPAYRCENIKAMLEFYLSVTTYASANVVATVEKGATLGLFYPKIFDNRVGKDGSITVERPPGIDVENIPVMSGLHSSSDISKTVESLHNEAVKIKYQRLHHFKTTGLEADEVKESLERLLELKERYEEESL